jgi:3',5'-nucleoside bisphosphate phosphatase
MILHYDLHVHTVLSPCADLLMTPNNLWNMATLKGLDVVSFVDHNSLKQLPMLKRIGESYRALMLIGVEVALINDLHVLVYFRNPSEALEFDGYLESLLISNRIDADATTEQRLTDEEDQTIQTIPYLLSRPLPIDLNDLTKRLTPLNHRLVLAHWNRYPEKAEAAYRFGCFDAVEWTAPVPPEWRKRFPNTRVLINSDAHDLTAISERSSQNQLDLPEFSIDALFGWLGHE